MDVFRWTDGRSGIRWTVTVRVRHPGTIGTPGAAVVRFESEGETRELLSPLRPDPEDDDVLAELLDLTATLSSDPGRDTSPD